MALKQAEAGCWYDFERLSGVLFSGVFQNCTNVLEVATLPMNASAANTVFENQGILPSRPNIKGETAPPTRAIDEFNPNADERTHVGYSSAENV